MHGNQMTNDRDDLAHAQRTLLVVAHPGHELRLFGWMCEARPELVVLTDGSGSIGQPRVESSHRVLDASGAVETGLFGLHSDQDYYTALLNGDNAFFLRMETALMTVLRAGSYAVVVADPLEGYNPTHDLCRVIVNVALERLHRERAPVPLNFDYALTSPLPPPAEGERGGRHPIQLSEAALEAKIQAARGYPELAWEIDQALAREGAQAFAREELRAVTGDRLALRPPTVPPHYETYGEKRRDAGVYRDVIRYEQHVLPVVNALVASLPAEAR